METGSGKGESGKYNERCTVDFVILRQAKSYTIILTVFLETNMARPVPKRIIRIIPHNKK